MAEAPQNDPFCLHRFVAAQEFIYEAVCAELRAGIKESHWMWFIFPQIHGLGFSSTARFYAISSLAEAKAYLEHPILGPRLIECTTLATRIEGRTVQEIFGYPDYLKFRSSMTLFAEAADSNRVFHDALVKYFGGEGDSATLSRL